MTHYFATLWFCTLSLIAGLAALKEGKPSRFVFFTAASLAAVIPVITWLYYSLPYLDLNDEKAVQPFMDKLSYGSNQYFRGLLIKLFMSNPIVTVIGFGALIAAVRGKGGKDSVNAILIWTVIVVTVLSFAVHVSYLTWIKERGFIVIIPTFLFIFAGALDQRLDHSWAKFVPLAAVIMPFVLMGEYFKDREKIGPLQETLLPHVQACTGQLVLVHYRPSQHEALYAYVTREILKFKKNGQIFAPNLIDVRTVSAPPKTQCPIKAAIFLLRRNDDGAKAQAITQFETAGGQDRWLERNVIWKRP